MKSLATFRLTCQDDGYYTLYLRDSLNRDKSLDRVQVMSEGEVCKLFDSFQLRLFYDTSEGISKVGIVGLIVRVFYETIYAVPSSPLYN